MSKVGGNRNYGYGKQMAFAGRNALTDRYGEGHYATRAAHAERWNQFVALAKATAGVRDARDVDRQLVLDYGQQLAQQVDAGETSVAYAQNLLSTVNVVLAALRGDRRIRVSPAALVGQRDTVRRIAPEGMDRGLVEAAAQTLREGGNDRVASIAELARDFGLRFREASLLDNRGALRQAEKLGRINITEGTKGGRGHHVDRWVQITARGLETLRQAASTQAEARNLVPADRAYHDWRDQAYLQWRSTAVTHGLTGFHDLRAAYACDRYWLTLRALIVAVGRQADWLPQLNGPWQRPTGQPGQLKPGRPPKLPMVRQAGMPKTGT